MQLFKPLFRLLSIALLVLGTMMLLPLILVFYGDPVHLKAFSVSAALTMAGAVVCHLLSREGVERLISKQLFVITSGAWFVVPMFGLLPFLMMRDPLTFTDAVFETVSALTTTGSTVMSGLDHTPRDILLWRSILQWFGGIGIIGMAIAILPSLKVGGMRLFQTESSDWSEKTTPRAHQMLVGIITAYLAISVLCALAYWVGGMSPFNAINHAMTTVSTGGFSTSDSSFGQFDSKLLQWMCTFFMIAGSIPFLLYVRMWSHRSLIHVNDVQVKGLVGLLLGVSLILAVDLEFTGRMDFWEAFTLSALNVTSVVTTTGFASADYSHWGNAAIALFFFLTFIGGCSGSTSGGVKIFRCQIFFIMLKTQLVKSVHPNAVIASKFGGRTVSDDIIQSCIAFLFFLMTTLIVLTFLLSLTGLDFITSITGASTALMNVGPGLGDMIGPAGNFQSLEISAKWLLTIGMLLGRLEFLAVMILFTRTFWRG
ncbi:potassium transporter TrkH [Hahella sp. CCB-MM4]|uniref:TrkH family potassium uptake protein n=1 Tax=Hahella sp. (strain CCB-MM4) TaxID=1926491 RepID=UPI000B9A5095|nr:TrkH family potassium uptake protein [Hahella sp. CCB-MM4]OZG73129.1 potassium transporter TrkH [Hahella sp. CCB-MM4]